MLGKPVLALALAAGLVSAQGGASSSFASVASASGSAAAAGGSASASRSASASASGSSAAAAASATPTTSAFLQQLQANSNTSAFASALAALPSGLGVQSAINDPNRNLTILAPPAAALQALSSNKFIGSTSVTLLAQNGSNVSVPLLGALLAYHIINGSYSAADLTSAVSSSGGTGAVLGTLLQGAFVDVFGLLGPATPTSMSASMSASASASSASSSASSNVVLFANNAQIIGANAIAPNATTSARPSASASSASASASASSAAATGSKYVHLLDRALDPFFPLVGITEPLAGVAPNGTTLAEPTVVAAYSSVSGAPTSSASSARSAAAASGSSGIGSVSATPIGPLRPSSSIGSVSGLPSLSATARFARWG